MKKINQSFYKLLLSSKLGQKTFNALINKSFAGSKKYWEHRYLNNGNSGKGSYGNHAVYKATVLNQFVLENDILSAIEFGCGDGNQLKQFEFKKFAGLDVSQTAIKKCNDLFKNDSTKSFYLYDDKSFDSDSELFHAELGLSLDVVYHLVEDAVLETYMRHLFTCSTRFVVIYAWDVEGPPKQHVRHRKFTTWIDTNVQDWELIQVIANKKPQEFCDFFIYKKLATISHL